jgi:hypothetical protein
MSQHEDPKPTPNTSGDGWRVLSYLIGGVLVYGGIGFGLDRWLTILMLHFRYGRS